MSKVTKPRGFNDLDPSEFEHKSKLLNEIKTIFNSYFFKEIETPIVEKKELFIRSVGEETDIVNKEMFTFQDRKGEGLVLRPEGTAGCLRFAIDSGLLDLGPIKLSYA
ncbi:MAG: ATP phosphoribosyltransferase regulatory subunit, partial [Gammaproteobacteria bacterium]